MQDSGGGMTRRYDRSGDAQFTWRGGDVSRTENLSDIVFALVLALAAVESVPRSFDELTGLWREALALAICFALIILIWYTHHHYFRRFGLQDRTVTALNSVLLLLVLAYIFPLKFMAVFVITLFTGGYESIAQIEAVLRLDQVKWLYLIYGGFLAGVYLVFAALHAHALARAVPLQLTARERAFTRGEIEFAGGVAGLTALVVALAFILPERIAPFSGVLFALTGLVGWVAGARAEASACKQEAAQG
ncbi:MAG: DUF1211 domain-containing protein [Alphaproteobacteria bacterium]|nr:DUF1211 domain-containing protein [Alphaproteobacteria bacterium]